MANLYVYSGAAGTGTGADWTNAKTTLAAAATASAAGDDIWVADDHAETQGSALSATFPGLTSSPNRIFCARRVGGTVPPVAADLRTTATVTTTGAFGITLNGSFYCYGITFNCGTGSSAASLALAAASTNLQRYEACAFRLVNTATTGRILPSSSNSAMSDWLNTTVQFANASQGINHINGPWTWRDTASAVTGATLPTILLPNVATSRFEVVFSGVDLSAITGTLFAANSSQARLVNCKLGSGVVVASSPNQANAGTIRVIGSHSSGVVERNEIYAYMGTLTTETTIVRTAGASDGTTPYSYKIVTTANSRRAVPFETLEGALWNTATGSSKTLTFHCVTDNVTLQDADIWVDVEYLGSSATPLASLASSAPATALTTGSNLTGDSGEAWTTTGLVTPNKQQFSVSFTPQMAGPVRWKVKVAEASTTVYVDPNPDLA